MKRFCSGIEGLAYKVVSGIAWVMVISVLLWLSAASLAPCLPADTMAALSQGRCVFEKSSLIAEQMIAVDVDLSGVFSDYQGVEVLFDLKPEHVDIADDFSLGKVSITRFSQGKGRVELPIRELPPAKYRLLTSILKDKRIIFSNNEVFNVVAKPKDVNAVVGTMAVFDSARTVVILEDQVGQALRVTPLISEEKLYVDVNARLLTEDYADAEAIIEISPLLSEEKKGGQSQRAIFKLEAGKGNAILPIKSYIPGRYRALLKITRGGSQIATAAGLFELPEKPEWLQKPVGIEALDDDYVLPPFIPITVAGDNIVKVWNRQYEIGAMGLPSQVVTARTAVLQKPVTLACLVDDRDIFADLRKTGKPAVTRKARGVVELSQETGSGIVTVKTKTHIEYDGYLLYTITITPKKPLSVDRLKLEMPVKAEYAPYLWAGGFYQEKTVDGPDILEHGFYKALSGQGLQWESAFKNTIWLGDDERGLLWFCDSEANWYPQDYARRRGAQQVVREGKEVTLAINLISSPRLIDKAVTYTFGFMATPERPRPKGWRGWKFNFKNYHADVPGHELANLLCYWPAPPWSDREKGYGTQVIADESAYRAATERDHEQNKIVLPYVIPQYCGAGIHQTDNAAAWVSRHSVVDTYGMEWKADPEQNLIGKGKRGTSVAMSVCSAGHWTDYMLWLMEKQAKCGADGIGIMDGSAVVCKNQLHGCGYVDDEGKLRPTYSITGMRNMCKRLTYMFQHERIGRSQYITGLGLDHTHAGTAMSYAKASMFDAGMKGEELNSGYYFGWKKEAWIKKYEELRKRDRYYYANMMTPELFRIEYGEQWGSVPVFLPQLTKSPGIDKEWAQSEAAARDYMVLVLLHDCHVLGHWSSARAAFDSWKAKEKFGIGDEEVKFFPYWKNEKYVTSSDPDVKVSFYTNKGKILAIVGNLSKTEKGVDVRIDLPAIGVMREATAVFDGITDEKVGFVKGRMRLTLPPRDYRMIILSRDKMPYQAAAAVKPATPPVAATPKAAVSGALPTFSAVSVVKPDNGKNYVTNGGYEEGENLPGMLTYPSSSKKKNVELTVVSEESFSGQASLKVSTLGVDAMAGMGYSVNVEPMKRQSLAAIRLSSMTIRFIPGPLSRAGQPGTTFWSRESPFRPQHVPSLLTLRYASAEIRGTRWRLWPAVNGSRRRPFLTLTSGYG